MISGRIRNGTRIIFEFGKNESGELQFTVRESFGSVPVVTFKQKSYHRPAKAMEELIHACFDLGYVNDLVLLKAIFKYWACDMDLTKNKRIKEVKDKLLQIEASN